MSAETSKKSNKRKSMGEGLPSDSKVRVTDPSSSVGPVFVNFPSVRPSANTPFTVYTRDPGSSSDIIKQHTLIAGETEDVEYFSTNRDRTGGSEGKDCQYLPAIYNPSTGSLDIYASTPLYLLGHRVKRLRNARLTAEETRMAHWREQRNTLGETFGTKKAKSQIRADERNKVDIVAMESIKGHLINTIAEGEKAAEVVQPSELIPQPNMTSEEPSLIYPREALLGDAEWNAIDYAPLIKAKDDKERSGLLPWRRCRFVENKMRLIVGSGSASSVKKNAMRMAYYLSALLCLYNIAPRLGKLSKSEIPSKFPGVPKQTLDGLLDRFTETDGKKRTVTDKMKTKLLAWICVVWLHMDEYSVELGKTAKELALPQAKIIDIFKSLGCKVDIASPAEREKLGISMADARLNRRAVLKAPVVFPRQRTRAPTRR